MDWIKLAHCYLIPGNGSVYWIKLAHLILGNGSVDWIKLACCYFVLGNMGMWTGLNWLTVTSYWGTWECGLD